MESNAEIPLIDFSAFVHGSTRDRERVASAVDTALSSIGFIYLSNHGIDLENVDECFYWSKRFFALPESTKKEVAPSADQLYHYGYSGVGEEIVRGRSCMKEGFSSGSLEDNSQIIIWPPEELLPGFRNFMDMFFKECTCLTRQLLDCLSLALNLPSTDSLTQHHASSSFGLNLIHYPAASADLFNSGAMTRIEAHSDSGTITLLFQDNVGGLEIADLSTTDKCTSVEAEKKGKFRRIRPIPGTVIVNVGYLLMRWSNGRWKNTVHRVSGYPSPLRKQVLDYIESPGVPETSAGDAHEISPERYSIPFFVKPDPATIVEALPGCWSEELPKRWKPLNAGDYLRRKWVGMSA